MFNCLKKNLSRKIVLTSLLTSMFFPVYAVKVGEQVTEILSEITNNSTQSSTIVSRDEERLSSPNSSIVLDFSIASAESWDAKNKPKNLITNCLDGTSITGFEYSNITVQTVGNSFLSEAIIYFSNSNNADDGVRLAIGSGNENSGTSSFSSDGIMDITDNELSDVISLNDSKFNIQFYETIDDTPDAIDARFINGTLKIYGVDLIATENCRFIAGKVTTDLSVEYSVDQSENIRVGDTLEFTIDVSNNGTISATNVVLSNSLPSVLQLQNMSCGDGTNTSDVAGITALSVQDIPANSSLQCVLHANVLSAGQINSSVVVSADNDLDSSNNSANLSIAGAITTIPVNNKLLLLLLVISLLFFSRRKLS